MTPATTQRVYACVPVVVVLGVLVGLSFLIGSCAASTNTGPDNLTLSKTVDVICISDALLQPVAVPVVVALAPGATSAATLDVLLIHPAVVAACGAYARRPAQVIDAVPSSPEPVAVPPPAPAVRAP